MLEDNVKQKIEAKKLYVELKDSRVSYKVLFADNKEITDIITSQDLPADVKMPMDNTLEAIKLIKSSILGVTSKRGHTLLRRRSKWRPHNGHIC